MLRSAQAVGQVFAVFVITVAAAEVGIGLAIVLMIFRNRKSANVDELDLMQVVGIAAVIARHRGRARGPTAGAHRRGPLLRVGTGWDRRWSSRSSPSLLILAVGKRLKYREPSSPSGLSASTCL